MGIFVYDPDTSAVKRRAVTVGGIREDALVIIDGLKEGNLVALAVVSFLKVGALLGAETRRIEQSQPISISFKISSCQETSVTQSINGARSKVARSFVMIMLLLRFCPTLIIANIVPSTAAFACCG